MGINLEGAGATAGRAGARLSLFIESSARLGFAVECAEFCCCGMQTGR